MPDFDSLSSEEGRAGASGRGSGGTVSSTGGTSAGSGGKDQLGGATSGGTSQGGETSAAGGTNGGEPGVGGETSTGGGEPGVGGETSTGGGEPGVGGETSTGGGEPGVGGEPVVGGETSTGGEAGESASGGEGGAPVAPCTFTPPNTTTRYNDFSGGLNGPGFVLATTEASTGSTLGATATSAWSGEVGRSCPGALGLEAVFKGYAPAAADDEAAVMDLRFSGSNWTGATRLHAWFKIEPGSAPLRAVQFFVISGSAFLYRSTYDQTGFRGGQWYELVIPLNAGADFDPADVRRIGVTLYLQDQGEGSNPPLSGPIHAWMDDVWVEY
jgi:hypothetical protein